MKPLSGLDGLFLHLETPATPMHVGSLSLLDLPANHRGDFCKAVQRLYARRLALAPVLSRKLATMPLQLANPVWVQADDIDMKYDVQRVADRFYVETQAFSDATGTNRVSVRSSAKLTLASLRLRATRAAVLLIPRSRSLR